MNRSVKTYCRICEPACGLQAEVRGEGADAEIVRIVPDKDHAGTRGFACHKGLKFNEVHTDPGRLNYPLKRTNRKGQLPAAFLETDWDSALCDIAEKLRTIRLQYGDSAVAGFMGNPTAFSASAARAVPAFFKKLKSRFFSSATQDCSNKFAGSEAVFGTSNLHPTPDLDNTHFFLCLGENPKVSHMSFMSLADPVAALRAIVARGGRVLHINPRRTESVTPATGEWVAIQPDTDLYFLAALIHEIDQLGRFDEALLQQHGSNVQQLRDFVSQYPASRVAGVCGISAAAIEKIAADFSSAESASVHMSTGVNMGRQGTLCYWLLHMLSLVSGNLGRKGGNVYSPGLFPTARFGRARLENDTATIRWQETEFGTLREVLGALPGNLLPDYIASRQEPIRALIVIAGNPLLSMAGEEAMRRAFPQLELLVVLDIYRNATAEYADYLLPMADWLEREDINTLGLGFQPRPWVQLAPAVVPPKFQRRSEWWTLARIEQLLGLPSLLDDEYPEPLADADRLLAASGLSLEALRQSGGEAVAVAPATPETLFSQGIQLPERRIDCCPAAFADALVRSEALFEELQCSMGGLKLVNLRTHYMHNSWMQNIERLKRPNQLTNPLHISPDDAAALNLCSGDAVHIRSDHGELQATIHLDETLRPGVVAMSHGWGNQQTPGMAVARRHPGVNVNRLLPAGPGSFEPLSNQAHMTGVSVELSAV